MKNFTNRYMLLYSLGLAAVVALLLTVVATGLKERQQNNIRNEKMQQLLATIGIDAPRDGVQPIYNQYFKEELNVAQDGQEPLTLYLYEKEGQSGYVIPTTGNGLWGKVYANVALADDLNTITGITFSHDSETPGLGAEITSDAFCNQFIGKQILDNSGNVVSVAVVKHADPSDPHQVDAISGGTMTSNGVSAMLLDELKRYQDYISSQRKEANNEQ
ncbi:MAG: NADH:ubiquinone reductase (Na(+)-transporting) subunit C [Bacteroidales bacterium]|jgi:Na+-transporting NADH:ubiquinone oxidoreductase subunit C|nr:NADH:ubiquinone reductase (Na(+)-transporting) subunit C [Bacteroidales bacterium]MBR3829287.1 NADH:ubiquinone reductase (Na(+)-transporting) subunit C [Bacteroidales bacterium]